MKDFLLYFFFLFQIISPNCFSQETELNNEEKYYLNSIEKEMLSKNYGRIIKIVDKAIEKGVETNKLIERRAIAYYILKNNKKAFIDIEHILQVEEIDEITYPIISLYYAQNYDNLNSIETLIKSYEKNSKHFYNSLLVLHKKDAQKIIVAIDSILTKEDYPKNIYAIKSLLNYSQNNFNDSYTDLVKAIEIDKNNGYLYFIFGETKLRAKEYISAHASYNAAIEYGYIDIEVYKKRAMAKGFMDDFKGAIEDYNIILSKNANDFETLYLRAIAKNFLKDYHGSIADFNQSIMLNDSFPSSYNYRGIVYINVGDFGSALLDFYKTLSLNPNHPFTHNNIGIAQVNSGQSASAESYFNKAIELDPKHADAYYNRGKLLFKKGNFVKAKSDFLKSIEINFQNPDAHYHLALILIQENKKSKRKKFEQRICEQLETASKMNHPRAQELLNQLCQKIEPEIEEIQDIE